MNYRHPSVLLLLFLAAAAAPAPAAPAPPPAAAVIASMRRAADWQLAHPAKFAADGWIQGAWYIGLSALAGMPGGEDYHGALLRIGKANDWQLGRRRYHADDQCVGQTYAELYLRDRDPVMISALRARCDDILAHPSPAGFAFDKARNPNFLDRWSWCDSLFMAPPAWIRLTAATGNGAYARYAVEQWWETTDFLYDKQERLFYRDSTFFSQREANGKKIFWGRGNGWVIAGLARALEFLPAGNPARPRFEALYRELADRLIGLQQSDGFWRSSLLDPDSYPMKESSGTGLICYGLARGMNHGILDRASVEPPALRAWEALQSCVAADGKVTHVQPVGASPKSFPADSTVPYGVGAYLLAGSEIAQIRP
jgi:unsaturated rhamnogalacturonyl hydrolase